MCRSFGSVSKVTSLLANLQNIITAAQQMQQAPDAKKKA
jgi:hypothetical protein